MIRSIEGCTPETAQAAFIAENATVCGDVKLGEESSVWFGAVLRAEGEPLRVGSRTNIQDNVTVHVDYGYPVSIGNNVTVGHNAVVHGCTVEDDVLVGMGSTILNGAVIGKGSVVAAGALVLEGAVVPPNSLVAGVPAKVKKTFTEEEVANRVAYYTPMYVREAKEYAEAEQA